jgi:hypothetical protein
MPSRFKRAHKTHALAQRAGEPYPRPSQGQAAGGRGSGSDVLALFAQLRERVPDAARRAELLGVSEKLEAAWQQGSALPALRARRRALERALESVRA